MGRNPLTLVSGLVAEKTFLTEQEVVRPLVAGWIDMGRNTLTPKPWSYDLYLESLEENVDWEDWSRRVKKYQEDKKKRFP